MELKTAKMNYNEVKNINNLLEPQTTYKESKNINVLSSPEVKKPRLPHQINYDSSEDFHWFVNNYEKFQKRYGNCYIAIKDKTVLGTYETFGEGVRETSKNYEIGTFIVQRCEVDQKAYIAYYSNP